MAEGDQQKEAGIREVMLQALAMTLREREPLFLIITLVTVLNVMLAWPFLDNIWIIISDPEMDERQATVQVKAILDNSFLIVMALLVTQAANIIWTRLWTLGRGAAMEGGAGALLQRTLWATYRYFGSMIWIILGSIIVAIPVSFIVGLITGVGGSDGALSTTLISLILYGALAMVLGLVLTAYGWSIYGECQDRHSSIVSNLMILKNRALAIGGGFLLALIIFIAVIIIPYNLLLGSLTESGRSGSIPVTFILWYMIAGFAGSLFSFYWITFSGLLLRRSKNAPVDMEV